MTKPISIRLDQDLRPRLNAILATMSAKAGGVKIEFSNVLRYVLMKGLQVVEQELGIGGWGSTEKPVK